MSADKKTTATEQLSQLQVQVTSLMNQGTSIEQKIDMILAQLSTLGKPASNAARPKKVEPAAFIPKTIIDYFAKKYMTGSSDTASPSEKEFTAKFVEPAKRARDNTAYGKAKADGKLKKEAQLIWTEMIQSKAWESDVGIIKAEFEKWKQETRKESTGGASTSAASTGSAGNGRKGKAKAKPAIVEAAKNDIEDDSALE